MGLVNIDNVINLFGVSDMDIYAKGIIEDALCDGTLKIIELERKKGKWIATHETNLLSHPDSITYVCSECGYKSYTLFGMPSVTNFCPNCGADMRGDDFK